MTPSDTKIIAIDPIEELLKANVIVGTIGLRGADRLRWLIGKMREELGVAEPMVWEGDYA